MSRGVAVITLQTIVERISIGIGKRGVGTTKLFPYLASFSDSRHLDDGSVPTLGWDLSVYTASQNGALLSYKLSARNNKRGRQPLLPEGVSMVTLATDLNIEEHESNRLSSIIIKDSYEDFHNQSSDPELAQRLGIRERKLTNLVTGRKSTA
ncbi:MAG: hypothetical protein WDN66_04365 [Candidatus Saccharibacteria bacterium]